MKIIFPNRYFHKKKDDQPSKPGVMSKMKVIFWIAVIYVSSLPQLSLAQGVGINNTGVPPHASAGLDVDFNQKGFLPPRLTTAQRDSIVGPAEGLFIYNLTTKCVEVFYGTFWQSIHCGCSLPPSNLVYADNGPIAYCQNQLIPLNVPGTQGGQPTSYTVIPPLPSGIQINAQTGQMSGSPTGLSSATNYTITATNACGNASRVIQVSVVSSPATPANITGPTSPTASTSATYTIGVVPGATSYTWTVPVGWSLVAGQGTNTITVTVGTTSGSISVTASNHCGVSSAANKSVTPWRPIVATGGTVSNYTGDGTNGVNGIPYRVHTFNAVGNATWTVSDEGSGGPVDYLVVAGGGGGAGSAGCDISSGGGGAGGVRTGNLTISSPMGYGITVGAGGIGSTGFVTGGQGSNSVFSTITSTGGGGGSTWENTAGNGGSGGGCGENGQGQVPGTGIAGQGNNGGQGTAYINSGGGAGGGGGGAAAVGQNFVSSTIGGNGGAGIASLISGTQVFYGGGGGGAGHNTGGNGGIGGGGAGRGGTTGNGADASNNSGGGGGGALFKDCPGGTTKGGNGGSGIVILRYPLQNPNP